MLTSIIISLYAFSHGDQDPVYQDKIYQPVGLYLIASTVAIALIYYLVVNGFRAKYNKWYPHWTNFLLLDAGLNAVFVLFVTHSEHVDFSAATFSLCAINMAYAAVGFFLVSLVFKWVSPHASYTPF